MSGPCVIAIDGPAAVGKSTVGQAVAERLGFFYFDTGLLYRALTWKALQMGVSPEDGPQLARLAAETDIAVAASAGQDRRSAEVRVDGQDVSRAIRSPEVDQSVSAVAAHAAVRAALLPLQRRIGLAQPTVMAGRDIGTVVFPDAPLKVFLLASPEVRARRRALQLGASPEALERVQAGLERRDRIDAGREVAPLRPAPDAVIIDTDDLGVAEVVARIVELARARGLDCH